MFEEDGESVRVEAGLDVFCDGMGEKRDEFIPAQSCESDFWSYTTPERKELGSQKAVTEFWQGAEEDAEQWRAVEIGLCEQAEFVESIFADELSFVYPEEESGGQIAECLDEEAGSLRTGAAQRQVEGFGENPREAGGGRLAMAEVEDLELAMIELR